MNFWPSTASKCLPICLTRQIRPLAISSSFSGWR